MESVKEQPKLTDNLTQDNFHSFLSRFVPAIQYLYEESSLSKPVEKVEVAQIRLAPQKNLPIETLLNRFRKGGVWSIQAATVSA